MSYREAFYFNELPTQPWEHAEREEAEAWADKLADARAIYRGAYFAATGDDEDRHGAGFIALSTAYPGDLDLQTLAEIVGDEIDRDQNTTKEAA